MKVLKFILAAVLAFAAGQSMASSTDTTDIRVFEESIRQGKLIDHIAEVKQSGQSLYDPKTDTVQLMSLLALMCTWSDAPFPALCQKKGDLFLAMMVRNGWHAKDPIIKGADLVRQGKEKGIFVPVPTSMLPKALVQNQSTNQAVASPVGTAAVSTTPLYVTEASLNTELTKLGAEMRSLIAKGDNAKATELEREIKLLKDELQKVATKEQLKALEVKVNKVMSLAGRLDILEEKIGNSTTGLAAAHIAAKSAAGVAKSALDKTTAHDTKLVEHDGAIKALESKVGTSLWTWVALAIALLAAAGASIAFWRRGVSVAETRDMVGAAASKFSTDLNNVSISVKHANEEAKKANAKASQVEASLTEVSKEMGVIGSGLDQVRDHLDIKNVVDFAGFEKVVKDLKEGAVQIEWTFSCVGSDEKHTLLFDKTPEEGFVILSGITGQLNAVKIANLKGVIGRAAQPYTEHGEEKPHKFTAVKKVEPLSKPDPVAEEKKAKPAARSATRPILPVDDVGVKKPTVKGVPKTERVFVDTKVMDTVN